MSVTDKLRELVRRRVQPMKCVRYRELYEEAKKELPERAPREVSAFLHAALRVPGVYTFGEGEDKVVCMLDPYYAGLLSLLRDPGACALCDSAARRAGELVAFLARHMRFEELALYLRKLAAGAYRLRAVYRRESEGGPKNRLTLTAGASTPLVCVKSAEELFFALAGLGALLVYSEIFSDDMFCPGDPGEFVEEFWKPCIPKVRKMLGDVELRVCAPESAAAALVLAEGELYEPPSVPDCVPAVRLPDGRALKFRWHGYESRRYVTIAEQMIIGFLQGRDSLFSRFLAVCEEEEEEREEGAGRRGQSSSSLHSRRELPGAPEVNGAAVT